ncbi:Rpr2-domain-containing protein [Neoconidiobolus thromboides FSU 785]|nr:Rpr2-domain-containing protein [Neoconidiobolus thromboides FSU 785]
MGKKEKLKKGKKAIENKEILLRMNFLYQASNLMSNIDIKYPQKEDSKGSEDKSTGLEGRKLTGLSRAYLSNLKSISKKLVIKMDPAIKRNICKRCNSNLILGKTCSIKAIEPNDKEGEKKKHIKLEYTCQFCYYKKSYLQNPEYQLFSDKKENILE